MGGKKEDTRRNRKSPITYGNSILRRLALISLACYKKEERKEEKGEREERESVGSRRSL